jgi:hypothetical protein
MDKYPAIVLCVLLSSCAAMPAKQRVTEAGIAGCYAKTDEVGYNTLRLTLNPDLTYTADLQGDIGSWGKASGQWAISDNAINLAPDQETERMVGFLRQLIVKRAYGRYSLQLSHGSEPLENIACPKSSRPGP